MIVLKSDDVEKEPNEDPQKVGCSSELKTQIFVGMVRLT